MRMVKMLQKTLGAGELGVGGCGTSFGIRRGDCQSSRPPHSTRGGQRTPRHMPSTADVRWRGSRERAGSHQKSHLAKQWGPRQTHWFFLSSWNADKGEHD